MKKIWNKIVIGLMILSQLASFTCFANATSEVVSFSDVPPIFWGYETIMKMTEHGIFKGTTEPINGIGTFSPEKTMTRAEFITAALRAVYPEMSASIETDKDQWWRGYYVLALDKELIKSFELDDGDLSQPMVREEMAMVMVRCVEKMGEELEKRVVISQIADYDTIDSYYKDYVRDCFSYGLLCGVDTKGTFAPTKTLTRAEAATVLCRLIDDDMRVDVVFVEEPAETDDDNRWDSDNKTETTDRSDRNSKDEQKQNDNTDNMDKTEQNDKVEENNKSEKEEDKESAEIEKPDEVKPEKFPWEEVGAKQPKHYTWAEYEALSDAHKEMFFEWFDSADDYEDWMSQARFEDTYGEVPWENGGDLPSEYTWAEYEALSDAHKELFFEWFNSAHEYEEWMNQVKFEDTYGEVPWKNSGDLPSEYTWAEYEALSDAHKEMFFEWFDSADDYENWMSQAKFEDTYGEVPWKNGVKLPDKYAWAEYEALSDAHKEMFFEWFETVDDFKVWFEENQPQ